MSKIQDDINRRNQAAIDDDYYYGIGGNSKIANFFVKLFIFSIIYLIVKGKDILPHVFMQHFDRLTFFKVAIIVALWVWVRFFKKLDGSGWIAFGAYTLLSAVGL